MVNADVLASYEVRRWLNTTTYPWDARRQFAAGHWWVRARGADPRDPACEWVTQELVAEAPGELTAHRRNGRGPDMVIDDDTVDLFGKLRAARDKIAADIPDAYRGLEPTLAETDDGSERLDYGEIPMKTASGDLSKYAKNLIDMNAPAVAVEQEIAEHFSGGGA